ncbi:MAG: iron-containing alcohol dehydrogenase family protein [Halanaerobiales bacterium]
MHAGIVNDYVQSAPVHYLNSKGIIKECGEHFVNLGNKAVVSGGVKALKSVEDYLFASLDRNDIAWVRHLFRGECSKKNISLIEREINGFEADFLIGVGGGKALDTAKVAAEKCDVPVVTIPTIAATCAAVTALSVVYNEEGQYEMDYYLKRNPEMVLVEPRVIAEAPVEYLKSGIFDAIAKWYEGREAIKSIKKPDVFAEGAVRLAEMLNKRMETEALPAVEAVEDNQVDRFVTDVIDLNIYLTGLIQNIGQMTCRGAAAHAVHNGLTLMEASHELLHGYKVAYGIIVQLYLEDWPQSEINEVISFFKKLGLTPSLANLGLPDDPELLQSVAKKAVKDFVMTKMPFKVTREMLVEAMEQVEKDMTNHN